MLEGGGISSSLTISSQIWIDLFDIQPMILKGKQ